MKIVSWVAVATAVWLLGACSPSSSQAPSASPVVSAPIVSAPVVQLRTAAPVVTVPVEPVPDAKSLRLAIVSITNNGGQGIILNVSIVREGAAPVPVGTVSPFPVDQPSDLRLPLTPAMAEALGSRPAVTVQLAAALSEPLQPEISLQVSVRLLP